MSSDWMDKLGDSFRKLTALVSSVKGDYVEWVTRNPGKASDAESAIKLLSYLLHSRLKKSSEILPELIYCGANILSFWHDRLIQQNLEAKQKAAFPTDRYNGVANGVLSDGLTRSASLHSRARKARDGQIHRIKTALTIIDYLEVFLEVSARQLWGDVGRWIVIVVIQAVKTGLRASLLLHYKVGLVGSSTLYQRRYARKHVSHQISNVTFVLKHSGKTVRKINNAPSIKGRDWTSPPSSEGSSGPFDLTPSRKIAEIIHILRPMTHLACMGIWGTKSWAPWLVSFGMDMTSLQLHSKTKHLRRDEKLELTRRAYAMCYYLMRSPFYDNCTKKRLLGTLITFSERIPLVGQICGILAKAIPEWQNTYSYMWTDY